ncbi:MAG: tetratricopeptide repeat protein [Schleiferiaceae bacterium]
MRSVHGFIICVLFAGVFASCSTEPESSPSAYWNHGDSVQYVGLETCAGCHHQIAETFQHTGMGSSFGDANRSKSAGHWAEFHDLSDPASGLRYRVFWRNDRLHVTEYLMDGRDTVHSLTLAADYIVGSGQHTNSHMVSFGGFLYQMPFTFYTQKAKADLPPGFESGANSRFNRLIGLECLSCHNAMPTEFVMGSENKFAKVPGAIDCERCHGPGSAHVAKIQRGIITDTSQNIDYSIVNPKKLTSELKMELCQRCHLQGNAVLADGRSFLDFRPGMRLSDVMDVYVPRYANDPSFIMASHADRLKQSACYLADPKKLDCTTCHNPHVSVRHTNKNVFNEACQGCHRPQACSAPKIELDAKMHQCVDCHMPVSGTEDIPHVTVHDHKIGKPLPVAQRDALKTFVGLYAVNNPTPSRTSRIRAYLQQYERFESDPQYLDSARVLLAALPIDELGVERTNWFYLTNRADAFATWMDRRGAEHWLRTWSNASLDNQHAWTCAKAAQMLEALGRTAEAEALYRQSLKLAPEIPAIRQKWGTFLAKSGRTAEAESEFASVLRMQPLNAEASSNLGYLMAQRAAYAEADVQFRAAIRSNPLYVRARVNQIQSWIQQGRWSEALHALKQAERIVPNHPELTQLSKLIGR